MLIFSKSHGLARNYKSDTALFSLLIEAKENHEKQGGMAGHSAGGELYSGQLIGMLELVWGEGWLSSGGLELARVKGPLYGKAVDRLGKDFADHNIDIWSKMLVVLETGEHCPTHVKGQKPV